MAERRTQRFAGRKTRDRAIVLLFAGVVLLIPPLVGLALVDASVAGIPFPVFYVFAVWVLLIAGAAALARPLQDSDETLPESGSDKADA